MNASRRPFVKPGSAGHPAVGTRPDGGMPVQQGSPLANPGLGGSPPAASLAGIAWIVIALASGTLGADQWAYVSSRASPPLSMQASLVVNLAIVVAALGLALLLLFKPTRGLLTTSIAFGLFVVVVSAAQVALGTTLSWLWFGATIAALLATGFSWASRTQRSRGAR